MGSPRWLCFLYILLQRHTKLHFSFHQWNTRLAFSCQSFLPHQHLHHQSFIHLPRQLWRWEKHKKGGGVELCFQKCFFLSKISTVLRIRVWKRSESEQSSEFECAADKNKRARERRRHKQFIQVPSTNRK